MSHEWLHLSMRASLRLVSLFVELIHVDFSVDQMSMYHCGVSSAYNAFEQILCLWYFVTLNQTHHNVSQSALFVLRRFAPSIVLHFLTLKCKGHVLSRPVFF